MPILAKTLKENDHFKLVPSYKITDKKSFDAIFEKLSAMMGSEGMMLKTPNMPCFTPSGKTGDCSKLKALFEIDCTIISRRKLPAPRTGGKKTSQEMMSQLSTLKEKSNSWTFRCAYKGPDGKLWPIYSDKTLSQGDLTLRWDESRQKWMGTEDNSEWETMQGFGQSMQGDQAYGNTYNFSPAEGEKSPTIGTIITISPAWVRAWESNDSVMVSWTFPRVRRVYPDATEPMDWTIINNMLTAVAAKGGNKPDLLITKDMKRPLVENLYYEDFIEAKAPTHTAQREEAEKIFGDPYIFKSEGKKSPFVFMHHLRGIWTESSRKQLLTDIRKTKTQEELDTLWKQGDCLLLTNPIESWQTEIRKIDDGMGDVSAEAHKYLDKQVPSIGSLDISKIVNEGNVHGDWRIKLPNEDALIGYTCTPPRIVIQFLENGKLEYPLIDKVTENTAGAKWPTVRKAKQPQNWMTIVTKEHPVFEAEAGSVGGTSETGGRFIFVSNGMATPGILKSDYHEWYFWWDKPYDKLSGRWGIQKLAGRAEYTRVPGAVDWWMMNRLYVTLVPYIINNRRPAVEVKAKKEHLKQMSYNPELLRTLANDIEGKRWLGSNSATDLIGIENEYSYGGSVWPTKK
jgi:hypothetical protein